MRKIKSSKVDTATALRMMSDERERVVRAAQAEMRASACFTDADFYGLPFDFGPGKPVTRSLGWKRPNEPMPEGCELIGRSPVSCLTELQAVRHLTDLMERFPCFNLAGVA